jgi:hypothetical protein
MVSSSGFGSATEHLARDAAARMNALENCSCAAVRLRPSPICRFVPISLVVVHPVAAQPGLRQVVGGSSGL